MKRQLSARELTAGIHLAVFVEPYLSAVLQSRKTIESRFAVHRRPPYGCIEPEDYILLKQSGGPVVGVVLAKSATFYQLSPSVLAQLRLRFADKLFANDDQFWESRALKQYATLIELQEPLKITPLPIVKRDRQAWVTYHRALKSPATLDV